MRTTKISIAIDKRQLRLARAAAKARGVSLSAFIGKALEDQLEEHERVVAARKLWAGWGADSVPTEEDRMVLRRHMTRARRRDHAA